MKNIDYQEFYKISLPHLILIPEWFLSGNYFLYKLFALLAVFIYRADMIYSRDIIINEFLAKFQIPSIYEIHQIEQENKIFSAKFEKLLKSLIGNDKLYKLVCISNELKEECIKFGFSPDKIEVLPSGVREDFFINRKKAILTSNLQISYIGSLQKGKGIDTIFKMAELMPENKFQIVGGDIQEFKYLPTNLEHISWVTPRKVLEYIKEADIVLLPFEKQSYKFYSPLKLFEYMAAGKIILASDIEGINSIIQDKYNGFLAESGNAKDFCAKINYIKRNPDLIKAVQKNAILTAELYTWKKRAEKTKKIIEKGQVYG